MMEALAVGLLGVIILAAWLVPKWRLRRAVSRPLPPQHVAILARNVMQYSGMDDLKRQQLARMVQHFLHQIDSSQTGGLMNPRQRSCVKQCLYMPGLAMFHRSHQRALAPG